VRLWLVALLAAQAAPSGGEPLRWPLEAGHRWTYVDSTGEIGLVLDARGEGRVEVRGPSIFWGSEGFVLEQTGGDWWVPVTESYLGPDPKPAPWKVLDGPLKPGRRWMVSEERDGVPFAFMVEVLGLESLSLPAGPMEAWHVRYRLTAHLGTEHDLDLWFADGMGLVKLARTAESTMGVKASPPQPLVLELARFERRGTEQPVADAPDDALQARVVATGPGRVGEPLPLRFSLYNTSDVPVRVLPALDASDAGWRYPKIEVELVDPDGQVQGAPGARCGMMNTLERRDLRDLRPGEELDPFGPSTFAHSALEHRPEKRGTWTVRFTYDTSGAGGWDPIEPDVLKLIDSVPHGVYRAETTIEVR
jgi:hypothetical protein